MSRSDSDSIDDCTGAEAVHGLIGEGSRGGEKGLTVSR